MKIPPFILLCQAIHFNPKRKTKKNNVYGKFCEKIGCESKKKIVQFSLRLKKYFYTSSLICNQWSVGGNEHQAEDRFSPVVFTLSYYHLLAAYKKPLQSTKPPIYYCFPEM